MLKLINLFSTGTKSLSSTNKHWQVTGKFVSEESDHVSFWTLWQEPGFPQGAGTTSSVTQHSRQTRLICLALEKCQAIKEPCHNLIFGESTAIPAIVSLGKDIGNFGLCYTSTTYTGTLKYWLMTCPHEPHPSYHILWSSTHLVLARTMGTNIKIIL